MKLKPNLKVIDHRQSTSTLKLNSMATVNIVDARPHGHTVDDLASQIVEGLSKPEGEKELPTILLYDERGLRLYDTITTDAKEYYLFPSTLR